MPVLKLLLSLLFVIAFSPPLFAQEIRRCGSVYTNRQCDKLVEEKGSFTRVPSSRIFPRARLAPEEFSELPPVPLERRVIPRNLPIHPDQTISSEARIRAIAKSAKYYRDNIRRISEQRGYEKTNGDIQRLNSKALMACEIVLFSNRGGPTELPDLCQAAKTDLAAAQRDLFALWVPD